MSVVVHHRPRPLCPHADEREAVQKKTFTKWVNSHLGRVTCRIGDLYTDLRDGRMLIRLLEVLSGEQLVSMAARAHTRAGRPQRDPLPHAAVEGELMCFTSTVSMFYFCSRSRSYQNAGVKFHKTYQPYTLWKQTSTRGDGNLPPTCNSLALLPGKDAQLQKYTCTAGLQTESDWLYSNTISVKWRAYICLLWPYTRFCFVAVLCKCCACFFFCLIISGHSYPFFTQLI